VTDLLDTPEEEDLRASVRSMLAAGCPWQSVLAFVSGGGEPFDAAVWRRLAVEMGLAGLLVPEEYGGAGAHWRAAAVVLEELGRAVAPVPFLTSAVVATAALRSAGGAFPLGPLASGAPTAALAVPFGAVAVRPTVTASGGRLTGSVRGVADGLGAGVLLVPAAEGLWVVEGDAGVVRTPVVSLDETRPLCDLAFAGAPARLVANGPAAAADALRTAATMVAAEQVGVASWCLDSTVEYVRTRHQFGRPVGSFQAVKHRLADLWVDLTQARAVLRHAVADLATGGADAPVASALAKIVCSEVAVRAAEECVQLHGGIGFTWEHPAHLYLKRAKATAIAYGSPDRHRARLAALVDLPAPPLEVA